MAVQEQLVVNPQPLENLLCHSAWRRIHDRSAQAGGKVTDPGGVQVTFGHCVERHCLVRAIDEQWIVGLGDPLGLFQLW